MAFLLGRLGTTLSWREILRRTFDEAFFKDNCLGLAAQLAYYFLFALFPALLVLIAVASYFPLHTLVDDTFKLLGGFTPPEVLSIITEQLRKISGGAEGGLLTLGVLTAIWSSSAAMTAIIDSRNRTRLAVREGTRREGRRRETPARCACHAGMGRAPPEAWQEAAERRRGQAGRRQSSRLIPWLSHSLLNSTDRSSMLAGLRRSR